MKMHSGYALLAIAVIAVVALILARAPGKDGNSALLVNDARSEVERLAAELDSRTTPTGVYVRAKPDEVQKADPWGTPLEVTYSQGGIAEIVRVRSAGPDRKFDTTDDIQAQRMAANLKGVGEGIKKNAEETAANAAKGLVKGAVQGVKESIRESLPRKKSVESPPSETETRNEDSGRNDT